MRTQIAAVFCVIVMTGTVCQAAPPAPSPSSPARPAPVVAKIRIIGKAITTRLDQEVKKLQKQGYAVTKYRRVLSKDGILQSILFQVRRASVMGLPTAPLRYLTRETVEVQIDLDNMTPKVAPK